MTVDLHVHSTASDGTLTPAQIVASASRLGITVLALTDHDTVSGIGAGIEAARRLEIELIPGVELSTRYDHRDIHILGLFVDYHSKNLNSILSELCLSRETRAVEMIEKLARVGVKIDISQVTEIARGKAVGRPHLAHAMLERGYVRDIGEAFSRYIGRGGPAYAEKDMLDIDHVINLIVAADGVPVLAHPGLSGLDEEAILDLKDRGIEGLEVWHPDHDEPSRRFYAELAERHGLIASGGSDCHGRHKSRGFVLGSLDLPVSIVAPLRARALERQK